MAMLLKIIQFYGKFLISFTAIGFWWRSLFWPAFKCDFAGQTWLVTGASGGLGRAIAQAAARAGATVLVAARSGEKLTALIAESGAGVAMVPLVVDFSLQKDTAAMMAGLAAAGRKIDVLVNNVGVLLNDFSLTGEGREMSFATNILNHFLLTEGLIENNVLKPDATVINMSSGGMYNVPLVVGRMNVTNPAGYNGVGAYAIHKRGQVELTKYWQLKYGRRGMNFYVMHPGWAKTEGVRSSLPRFYKILNTVLRDGHQGTDTAIWLAATKPKCEPGSFWFDREPRSAHVFTATRLTKNTANDLAEFLAGELAKV